MPNGLASRRKFSTYVQLLVVALEFVRKSTQVFSCLATQRKSTQVDRKSSVCLKLASRLRQVLVLQTCFSLDKRRKSPEAEKCFRPASRNITITNVKTILFRSDTLNKIISIILYTLISHAVHDRLISLIIDHSANSYQRLDACAYCQKIRAARRFL